MAGIESVASTTLGKLRVPFVDLVVQHGPLRARLLEAVGRVLDHGQFILGSEVAELEAWWARRCKVQHAVGVSNGTSALSLILKALNIGPGDEVVTAPNSFIASASSVVHVGATPRFADVGDDLNIAPAAVRASINEKTKAIIVVHLTGRPASIDEINAIAAKRSVAVIEDAAQAMGAKSDGRPVGGLSLAAGFSLHPLKTAGACGDAGMITTNDDALADRLRRLGNHGFASRQEDCAFWGYNARMDTVQAAMALVKLDHLDASIERRRAHASIYRRRLADLVHIPPDQPGDFSTYHLFPVLVEKRDELAAFLRAHEIGCAVHYAVPIHLLPAARSLGYGPGDLPVAEQQATRTLSLPITEGLTDEQVHHVCDVVAAFHG